MINKITSIILCVLILSVLIISACNDGNENVEVREGIAYESDNRGLSEDSGESKSPIEKKTQESDSLPPAPLNN